MSKGACGRGGGDVGLEARRFQSCKGGFHLVLHGTYSWAEKGGHRVCPSHLLKDGDEEADLNLGRVLEKTIKGSGTLCL